MSDEEQDEQTDPNITKAGLWQKVNFLRAKLRSVEERLKLAIERSATEIKAQRAESNRIAHERDVAIESAKRWESEARRLLDEHYALAQKIDAHFHCEGERRHARDREVAARVELEKASHAAFGRPLSQPGRSYLTEAWPASKASVRTNSVPMNGDADPQVPDESRPAR